MQGSLFSEMQVIELEQAKLSYWPEFFTDAQNLFETLVQTLAWQQDSISMYGKTVNIPRLQAFYADSGISYSYSGLTMDTHSWTDALLTIKSQVEQACDCTFNAVLANYYRDGSDNVGMHADDEPELGLNPIIASASFGAEREFILQNNQSKKIHRIKLAHGSLLLMHKGVQQHYKHGINKQQQAMPRVNLTFRYIYGDNNKNHPGM